MLVLLKAYFMQIITVSLISGAMIALIHAITPLVKKRYSTIWRYWAWLLLAVWMLLPITIPLGLSPIQIEVPDRSIIQTATEGPIGIKALASSGISSLNMTADATSPDLADTDQAISDTPDPAADADGEQADNPVDKPGETHPNNAATSDPDATTDSNPDAAANPDPETPPETTTTPDTATPSVPDAPANSPVPANPITALIPSLTIVELIVAFWLLGAAVMLLARWVRAKRFQAKLSRSWRKNDNPEIAQAIRQTMEQMGVTKEIDIRLYEGLHSPFVTGLLHPVLVLPDLEYDPYLLTHIIRHELTHYLRRDLWYKLIVNLASALHWFNPLVWLMNRSSDSDLELVCDEFVTRGQSISDRKDYGESILLTVKPGVDRRPAALTTSFSTGAKNLKERFENIMLPGSKARGRIVLTAVLSLALLFSFGFNISVAAPSNSRHGAMQQQLADARQPEEPEVPEEPEEEPEPPATPPGPPDVDIDLYRDTMWYFEDKPGQFHEMLYIDDWGEEGLVFNFYIYRILTLEGCQTGNEVTYSDTGFTLYFDDVSDVRGLPTNSMSGSLTFDQQGGFIDLEISQVNGTLSDYAGSYHLLNAADHAKLQRAIYQDVLGGMYFLKFFDRYYVYDIDGNGVPELIARDGESEANFTYNFYTISRAGMDQIGQLDAGHSALYFSDDTGICRVFAHMGHEQIFQIIYNGEELSEELVMELALTDADPDYYYPVYGELVTGYRPDYSMLGVIEAEAVVREFFDLFAQGRFAEMNRLCDVYYQDYDFTQGVFGMRTAEIVLIQHIETPDYHDPVPNHVILYCDFIMQPIPEAIYAPRQTNAIAFISLYEIDGEFKIFGFATSP